MVRFSEYQNCAHMIMVALITKQAHRAEGLNMYSPIDSINDGQLTCQYRQFAYMRSVNWQ